MSDDRVQSELAYDLVGGQRKLTDVGVWLVGIVAASNDDEIWPRGNLRLLLTAENGCFCHLLFNLFERLIPNRNLLDLFR